MLNRWKSALYTVVGGSGDSGVASYPSHHYGGGSLPPCPFPYTRPGFLHLNTEEEILVSADHIIRPILVPRDIDSLPWKTGYAEAINAGKSARNEDQGTIHVGILRRVSHYEADSGGDGNAASPRSPDNGPCSSLPYVYFGLFDGHAGTGAAIMACNLLHKIVHKKLLDVLDLLLPLPSDVCDGVNGDLETGKSMLIFPERQVTTEELVTGALETAFWEMDQVIGQEKHRSRVSGGCTALVGLFILGKLYVANAGDSRAIICREKKVVPMSQDFTPETERDRVRQLAFQQPELLGGEYSELEFTHRPVRKDLGKRMLYREAYMSGWAYKTVTIDDLRFPLVYGEGKRSRVLATIGVTRGFGDHDLKAQYSSVNIKPFLTPQPEVRIFNLLNENVGCNDVLVMGTDGLWDITTNEKAAEIVQRSLDHFPATDEDRYRYRYTSAAQDLVMHSRGKLRERSWKTSDGKTATIDDISVFVIPLLPFTQEYKQWNEARNIVLEANSSPKTAVVANGDSDSLETSELSIGRSLSLSFSELSTSPVRTPTLPTISGLVPPDTNPNPAGTPKSHYTVSIPDLPTSSGFQELDAAKFSKFANSEPDESPITRLASLMQTPDS